MLATSIQILLHGRTALIAVRDTHEAIRHWLATKVGTIFYRHTHRVGIEGTAEQWVTLTATVSETRIGFTLRNIFWYLMNTHSQQIKDSHPGGAEPLGFTEAARTC